MSEYISFKDFKKMDLKVGRIKAVKLHPNADKLYILLIDMGKEDQDRQIVTGLRDNFKEEELIGKDVLVLCNLEPKLFRGIESCGMILCAEEGDKVVLLGPLGKVKPGMPVC